MSEIENENLDAQIENLDADIESLAVEIRDLGMSNVEESNYLNGESEYLKNDAEEVGIRGLGMSNVEESDYLNSESDYLKNVAEEVVNGVVEMSSGGLTSSSSADASPSSSSSHKAIIKPDEDVYNYDVVFPSLPSTGNNLMVTDVWNNASSKLSIKKHLTSTQVFHVPVEERRYKDVNFGGNETNKKSEEIAKRLGVKVEICCSKDQSLHIVISGNEEKVLEAKKQIISELQQVRDQKIRVPKDQHKYLIGKT